MFFSKYKSKNEVINDLDGRVTNFYRIAQTRFEELQKLIIGTAHSELDYKKSLKMLKEGKATDVELAWAFWVQCNITFSSKIFAGFAFAEDGCGTSTYNKRCTFTHKYLERLHCVEIFQRDAIDLIRLKDSPNTFFYCDPPYVNSNCGHYEGYTIDNFNALLETLSGIKGKFLISTYPTEYLNAYRQKHGWNYKDIKQVLSVTGKRAETKYKTECLSWNYELSETQLQLF